MPPTNILVHNTMEMLLEQSAGAVSHIYTVAPGGVYPDPEMRILFVIQIYQDTLGDLHGLYYPRT